MYKMIVALRIVHFDKRSNIRIVINTRHPYLININKVACAFLGFAFLSFFSFEEMFFLQRNLNCAIDVHRSVVRFFFSFHKSGAPLSTTHI